MSNEIKVGDKVRVREDAPKIFRKIIPSKVFDEESKVVAIDSEMAVVWTEPIHKNLIPLKYLIKVDAEAKEPKFKVGDVVRIKPTADKLHQGYQNGYAWLPERDEYLGRVASVKEIWCDGSIVLSIRNNLLWEPIDLEPYTVPTTPAIKPGDKVRIKSNGRIVTVVGVGDRSGDIYFDVDGGRRWVRSDEAELIDKPTEEKNLQDATASELRDLANHGVAVGDEVKRRIKEREEKPNVGSIKIPVEIDLTDSYWDAYAADLAKEVVLKVANKYTDPKEAAEYAVSVAQAVVEGLKRK